MSQLLKLLSAVLIFPLFIFGQVKEVNPPDFIKTITFSGNTSQSQLPILSLGSPLFLEFDALNGDEADYYYKIEHFNFDWTPSVLMKSEYLRGFDNQRIINYQNSTNTFQIYSHYRLRIPNQQTKALLVTGNFMISIYDDDDILVFSRKFMVYTSKVNVGLTIKRCRDVTLINEKQNVDFTIHAPNFNINNPIETIKTVVIQNNNLHTAISDLKPQYTVGNKLIYRYNTASSFWGGNEYLFFENKDVRASNIGIQYIDLQDLYHTYLFTNTPRAKTTYTFNPDINGNFLITAIDTDDVTIEADYTEVFFSLRHPIIPKDHSIYVYGNYNNFALNDLNKMYYNEEFGFYECRMQLKQGFYNYKYVVVDAQGELHEGAISGNFYQTENNYKVLVYYRNLGARYDQLIGFGEASSINISN